MANLTFANMPATPNYSAPLLNFMGGGQQQGQGGSGGGGGVKPLQLGGQTFAQRLQSFLNPQLQPGYSPGAPMDLGSIGGPGAAGAGSFNPASVLGAIY